MMRMKFIAITLSVASLGKKHKRGLIYLALAPYTT